LIFHAADYDLRLLRKHHEFTPSAIFDTMLAARLLGERQFGLSHLAEKYLGVILDKGSQKADWARRPLTEKMETYARNDTHHLKPLADRLKAELAAKNRLAWHQESCARLIAECAQGVTPDPESVWRIKGSTFLDRAGLAVLRELWRWREGEAIAANRPPFFVLSHETMIALCAAAAARQPVENLIPPRMHPRRKETLMAALRAALALPPEKYPPVIRHHSKRPTEQEFRRFREIEQRRDRQASDLGLDPTIIASKSTLGDLAQDWEKYAAGLMNWQRELLKP
jgi:ribonuclease D